MIRRALSKTPQKTHQLNGVNTLRSPAHPLHHTRTLSTSHHHAYPNPPSTVHVGTSYERLCARTLPRLAFHSLTRTGGRADKGIDLLGKWQPPSSSSPRGRSSPASLNVVVQCKAVARKPGPEMVRELEGALAGAPGEWRGEDTVGVLCARREVTAGVRDALRRSKRGVMWVMVEEGAGNGGAKEKVEVVEVEDGKGDGDGDVEEEQEAREGKIRQILWNERVQNLVGKDTGTGVIHIPREDGGPMEAEVLLSWNGAVCSYDQQGAEDQSLDSSRLL